MRNPFLISLFDSLNKKEVKYVVLRNYQELPESSGNSDLDIFINGSDKQQFLEILRIESTRLDGYFVSVLESEICPRYCIMGHSIISWGIMIDLHLEKIQYRGYTIISNKNIWGNVQLYNNLCVLNNKTTALIGLLKELMNNRTCSEKYYTDFINHSLDISYLTNIFSDIQKTNVAEALSALRNTIYTKEQIKQLMSFLDKEFPYPLFYSFKQIKKLYRIIRKSGYTIAFLGTDGSGKSAIIELIKPILNQPFHNAVYYEHLRPNYFPSLARLSGNKNVHIGPVTNPHGSTPSGFIISLIRFLYYFLDYSVGFYMKIFPKKSFKSCVWIFDRYYYDYYFDQRRSLINLPKWIIRLGQALVPEPDIIICLGADPEIIHSRKPELPIHEVERQVKALKKFSDKHKRAFWVDTGTTIEESRDAALHHIVKVMAKRFEHVKLA